MRNGIVWIQHMEISRVPFCRLAGTIQFPDMMRYIRLLQIYFAFSHHYAYRRHCTSSPANTNKVSTFAVLPISFRLIYVILPSGIQKSDQNRFDGLLVYSLVFDLTLRYIMSVASCQIRKIARCVWAGITPKFPLPSGISDSDMHYGTFLTHATWGIPGSLTSGLL